MVHVDISSDMCFSSPSFSSLTDTCVFSSPIVFFVSRHMYFFISIIFFVMIYIFFRASEISLKNHSLEDKGSTEEKQKKKWKLHNIEMTNTPCSPTTIFINVHMFHPTKHHSDDDVNHQLQR